MSAHPAQYPGAVRLAYSCKRHLSFLDKSVLFSAAAILACKMVIFGIADDRVVQYVVAVVVLVQFGMQLRGALVRRLRGAHDAVLATRCLSW